MMNLPFSHLIHSTSGLVYIMKNSMWVTGGQIITSISAFIVMIALVNLVPKEQFGEYRFLLSCLLIISICNLNGMGTALVQATARGVEGQLVPSVRVRIRWGMCGAILACMASLYYLYMGNTSLGISFILMAALIPWYNSFFGWYFFLQGKERFDQASIVQSISRVVFVPVMILIAYLAPEATWLLGAYMVSTVAMQYLGYRWTTANYPEPTKAAKETTDYGVYLSAYGAPTIIAAQIGIVLVWNMLGAVEAAVFATAMMFPLEAGRFGSIINQVVMPRLAKQEVNIKQLFIYIAKIKVLLLVLWCVYALLAPHMFAILFPTYPEAVVYSIVGMLALLLIPNMVLHALVNAQKKKRIIRKVYILTPIVQIALTVTLLPLWGLWGAVAAYLIGGLFEYILLAVLIVLYYPDNLLCMSQKACSDR